MALISAAQEAPLGLSPENYVRNSLATHDIVFMGTTHKRPRILGFIAQLLPRLDSFNVTHLALEIGADQQGRINQFMQTGKGLENINLHNSIECPQYRNLLKILQELDTTHRPAVIALDLPPRLYGKGFVRDEYMAQGLLDIFAHQSQAKVFVILGSLHVLHKLEWENLSEISSLALRTYVTQTRPGLKMHSIINIIRTKENKCDFSQRLASFPNPMAFALDEKFRGWQMGLTRCIAIKPAHPHELTDGVIIY